MIKKILEKYGWIQADTLPDFIVKKIENAREEVRQLCKIEYDEKLEDTQKRLKMDHQIDVKDLESKITFLNREIDFLKNKVKETENIYNACWKGIKANLQVSSESKFQMKKLMESFQTIFQSLSMIEEAAEKQNDTMLSHDKDYREKLGLPERIK